VRRTGITNSQFGMTEREAPWSAAAELPLLVRDLTASKRCTQHALRVKPERRELRSHTPRLAFGAQGMTAKE